MNSYIIKKVDGPVTKESFKDANVAKFNNAPWAKFPLAFNNEARLLYTDEALYVNLKTDEKPLIAHQFSRNSTVFQDSCMEFYFSPDIDDPHFMNFEMNPICAAYISYAASRSDVKFLRETYDIFDIQSEINNNEWNIYYKIPVDFLLNYFEKISDEFRGNFTKCADSSPHPHYNCWNIIETPDPDFLCPEYFGMLKFEKGAPKGNK